ncbi:hypothetical protein Bca52824_018469 [Brassica carinata]|uniref:Glycine-rich protein n=1 Tax=Brassica carinata TaxID=52824 RepID=A0A8X7VQJ2_BRACI|nr:hypothetical protein Bca52824_018469 [Brassica carinata]
MEEESLKPLLILPPARVVIPPEAEGPAVQAVRRWLWLWFWFWFDTRWKRKGTGFGFGSGSGSGTGFGFGSGGGGATGGGSGHGSGTGHASEGVAQAVEMVELLQVVEREANTAKIISVSCSS